MKTNLGLAKMNMSIYPGNPRYSQSWLDADKRLTDALCAEAEAQVGNRNSPLLVASGGWLSLSFAGRWHYVGPLSRSRVARAALQAYISKLHLGLLGPQQVLHASEVVH